ncbi:hypothetical protein [Streptomyces sp. JJ38]|uniref:hypothetical protein n=1 Tax=Streptomyces sp. JJ38 TaxID=2738128 RepID=UPI001C57AADE|nr:hypothetical protein [Streptomyces sp. JJ38]MBW1598498.1 hypothetical protein [Streptomyces sp. JJ38]
MSQHHPPPQGPYGPPPQPNPYGAPQPPPQPYGQQHPGQPYPPPQGPGQQPGYGYGGQPAGYPGQAAQPLHGVHPGYQTGGYPPPEPRRGGAGKAIALTVGALVVVGAVIGGIVFLTGGGDGGGADIADDGPHRLVAPESVGDYRLSEDEDAAAEAGTEDEKFMAVMQSLGVSDGTSVRGTYGTLSEEDAAEPGDSASDNPLTSMKMAFFGGVWGEVDDPERAVDDFFRFVRSEAAKDEGSTTEFVGDPRAFTPEGFEGAVMKCQEIRDEQDGVKFAAPLCVWGDYSTVGMVVPIPVFGSMSIEAGAQLAADFRAEARVEVA